MEDYRKNLIILFLLLIAFFIAGKLRLENFSFACDDCAGHSPGDEYCVGADKYGCYACYPSCPDPSCPEGGRCCRNDTPRPDTTCACGIDKYSLKIGTCCHPCGCCIPYDCPGQQVAKQDTQSPKFVFSNELESQEN
ncbi:MAG: hypothetical protein NC826_02590 [Candidatus Omnitrophica bacterium]|nr:hypothetical protein [Candidatus Omnitrophota bacterium]